MKLISKKGLRTMKVVAGVLQTGVHLQQAITK